MGIITGLVVGFCVAIGIERLTLNSNAGFFLGVAALIAVWILSSGIEDLEESLDELKQELRKNK